MLVNSMHIHQNCYTPFLLLQLRHDKWHVARVDAYFENLVDNYNLHQGYALRVPQLTGHSYLRKNWAFLFS